MLGAPDLHFLVPRRHRPPAPTRLARRVEDWDGADGLGEALEPLGRLLGTGPTGELLRDRLVGHALHPSLTDVPIGLWAAAAVLDLRNRPGDRDAATLLEGLGILATLPTAATGVAEWALTGGADRRVGSTHAAANSAALALHTVSWMARRRGRHRLGVLSALLGNTALGFSALLGGHLTTVRKVGSRGRAG